MRSLCLQKRITKRPCPVALRPSCPRVNCPIALVCSALCALTSCVPSTTWGDIYARMWDLCCHTQWTHKSSPRTALLQTTGRRNPRLVTSVSVMTIGCQRGKPVDVPWARETGDSRVKSVVCVQNAARTCKNICIPTLARNRIGVLTVEKASGRLAPSTCTGSVTWEQGRLTGPSSATRAAKGSSSPHISTFTSWSTPANGPIRVPSVLKGECQWWTRRWGSIHGNRFWQKDVVTGCTVSCQKELPVHPMTKILSKRYLRLRDFTR